MESFVKLTLELPRSAAEVFTPPEDELGPHSLYFLKIIAPTSGGGRKWSVIRKRPAGGSRNESTVACLFILIRSHVS